MMKRFACVVVLFAFGVSTVGAANAVPEDNTEQSPDMLDWNVLVYMTADNNLNDLIQTDLDELMEVGSGGDVNVLVLVDSLYDSVYLYRVLEGGLEDTDFDLNGMEVNMGDPETLRSFVEFSDSEWPAERMMLFFWDHGSGIKGVGFDETTGDPEYPEGDWLSHQEVVVALEGNKVDIIAADECLVGQIEVAYEYSLGLETEYLVASEGYIGWRGFTYDTILENLTRDPGMSTEDAAVVIVDGFTEYFHLAPYKSEILTMQSVIDLSCIQQVVADLGVLTTLLCEDIDSYSTLIWQAQRSGILPWGERGNAGVTDLTHFVEYIAEKAKDSDVRTAAEAVLAGLDAAVVAMGTTPLTEMFNYEGLGIFFPHSYGNFVSAFGPTVELYKELQFADEGWLDFLNTYYAVA